MQARALRIALPGELYQKADRWWWRVKLPGEDKARARPLKANGTKVAAPDRKTAEQIALEMWEHAVGENAARQIRLESSQKLERLKAQFLDKVRHFTELVEAANAKVQAEAKARAEAEAKLTQLSAVRVGPAPPESTSREQAAGQAPPCNNDLHHEEAGVCECCGAMGVATTHLTHIDSGQSLCPRCLTALRADAARS